MSTSGIKSKPVYSPLSADTRGRFHLMLGFGPGGGPLLRVIEELRAASPPMLAHTRVLFLPDASVPRFEPAAPPGSAAVTVQSFTDKTTLLLEFRRILDASLMGTRLYLAGPESFLGLALRIALEFNMNKDEVRAEQTGTLARRIYCVHCQSTTEDVTTNIATCTGCGRWLTVRDHYSRRLAAYMGVMADAEVPGELPPVQEVYP